MVTSISHSEADTVALGEQWGREAQPGWVFGLSGPLGAGKTLLVRGLARGLGAPARVHSPTFALVHEYCGGRVPLFHLDLYRIEGQEQFERAGLDAYLFSREGVTAVEWFEHWLGAERPLARLFTGGLLRRVAIEVRDGNTRWITYEDTCA